MSVVETRWFRNETWPDTLWMLALAKITERTISSYTIPVGKFACTVGVKVYVDDYLISDGIVALAFVFAGEEKVTRTGEWTCPEISIDGKYVKVEVWVWVGTDYEAVLETFRTEVFNGRKLDVSTWRVSYTLSLISITYPIPRSSVSFHWDGDFLSRIENFAHSPIIIIPKRIQMDGLVMFLT